MLLDANADVNAVSQLGRTPLIVAASAHGSSDVVRLLLAKGADVNACGHDRRHAADCGRECRQLRCRDAAAGARSGRARQGSKRTAVHGADGAAVNGNAGLVAALLARKPDLAVVSADRTCHREDTVPCGSAT